MFEQSVRTHDRHQFELKLAYTLDDVKEAKSHDLTLYFFLPKSLGVGPSTYAKRDFFNDLIAYLRLKTPAVLLRELVKGPSGPLQMVEASMASLARRPDAQAEAHCEQMSRGNGQSGGASRGRQALAHRHAGEPVHRFRRMCSGSKWTRWSGPAAVEEGRRRNEMGTLLDNCGTTSGNRTERLL